MKNMKFRYIAVLYSVLLASLSLFASASEYRHFNWTEVVPGVWFGVTPPEDFQSGNVAIITLPSGGSIVVDTENAAFLGQEILEKAKQVGHGPVKYVVNTHMHQDHLGGNYAFLVDNPKVEIIAHKNTCALIPIKTIPRMHERLPGLTKTLGDWRAKRATMAEGDKGAEALDHRITGLQMYLDEAKDFKWGMPNECLDLKPGQEKDITDGTRRIVICYLGIAHTPGDLIVYLPKEKVLLAGDLWGEQTGWKFLDAALDGRDGPVLKMPETLRVIKKIDFDIALTGHSPISYGKKGLDEAIADGEEYLAHIKEGVDEGKTVTEMLQMMPVPENSPAFISDVWRNTIINSFEDIQLHEMYGTPLPDWSTVKKK